MARFAKPNEEKKRYFRRINLKALKYLGLGLALLLAISIPWKLYSDGRVRSSALAQAKEIAEKGDFDLALRHVNRYLDTWPDDIRALEVKAKLLGDTARSMDQVIAAAKAHDQLIRLDPSGEGRRETRRKLADLYIRYGEAIRDYANVRVDTEVEAQELRYVAAVAVARQLLVNNESDADAHRLLAMALEGQVAVGKVKTADNARLLDEAEKEFKEAIRLDPGNLPASERLAEMYLTRLNDPDRAQATLDALLKVRPDSVEVRLARYRAFARSKKEERARAELDAALRIDPKNFAIRTTLGGDALRRRDTADARRHLDAIPAAQQDALQVRVLRGMMEFAEQHPDDAIDQWRRGLSIVGGTDQDLTWQLAYALIQLGRLGEARPLVAQHIRLSKDDTSGMSRFLQAMLDQRTGNTSLAIDNLERARDRVPPNWRADLQLTLGRCYEAKGDEARAMLAYRRAATAAPQSSAPRRAIARLLQARDPAQALAELEAALTQSPEDANLIFDMIRIRIAQQSLLPAEQRSWREIDALFAQAEKIAPGNAAILELKGDYLAAANRLGEATELLSGLAKGGNRKRAESWLAWAKGLERMNRVDEALRVLEQGSAPDAAGDRAQLRIARARLLSLTGKGQAACEILTKDRDKVSKLELPELYRTLGELLRELGDRDGSRGAFAEWSRLAPDSPLPGLTLLALAQIDNDDEAARLGLESLRALGGDKEPYGLAAQALNLLRPDRGRTGAPSAERLDRAERLVARLQTDAPQLPITSMLRGMILEYRGKLDEALVAYRAAVKDDPASPALPRMIESLIKLKRSEELEALRLKFDEIATSRRQPGISTEFNRIAATVALRLGDKERAEYFASQIVRDRPDSVQARASQAKVLETNGKLKEAEDALRSLTETRPEDPAAWLALIAFQAPRRTPAELARAVELARSNYKGERPDLFLARCHWTANDLAKAAQLYDQALSKQPDDLVTLRNVAEFDEATGRAGPLEQVLRKALKIDASASWASRALALLITSRSDATTWTEAWTLVAPGAPGVGDSPEDRLVRATVLARSPENARRLEAIPAFVGLADDLPVSSPLAVEARLRLAQTMMAVGRTAEAWSYIAPLADDPNRPNPTALAVAVEALARSGKPDEADRRLDRLAELEPKSPRTATSRAWVLQARGKKAEIAASLLSAFAEAEPTPQGEAVGLTFLDLLMKFNDLDGAAQIAKKVSDRWPRDAWTLAQVQVAKKDYDQALASCKLALGDGSTRQAARIAISAAVAHHDDPAFLKEVSTLCESARAKAPGDYAIPVLLATVRHLQDRYEEEVALYRQALDLKPPGVQFLNNMAWTLSEGLNNPKEALDRIDEAIRREGPLPQYLDTRGVILGRLNRNQEAIADLERSIQGSPLAETYYHLARVYLKANKLEDYRRCRDLARRAKFDPASLDPTDRSELVEVMGKL